MRRISIVVQSILRLCPFIRVVDMVLLTVHDPLETLVSHHLTAHGYSLVHTHVTGSIKARSKRKLLNSRMQTASARKRNAAALTLMGTPINLGLPWEAVSACATSSNYGGMVSSVQCYSSTSPCRRCSP